MSLVSLITLVTFGKTKINEPLYKILDVLCMTFLYSLFNTVKSCLKNKIYDITLHFESIIYK